MKIQTVLSEGIQYFYDVSKCVFVLDIMNVVMGMNNHSRIKKTLIFC